MTRRSNLADEIRQVGLHDEGRGPQEFVQVILRQRLRPRLDQTTIYHSAGASTFADPDSFRAGIPLQTSQLRHVVIINLTDNSFTTLFENVVSDVSRVEVDGRPLRPGRVGQMLRMTILGQIVPPIPPNGWIAGFAVGMVRPSEPR
jgi:hypothetical protein